MYTLNLTVEDDKKKTDVKLLVGDRLAGESVYTLVQGHNMIDIVPSSLLETLGAPANSLRNSRLFDVAAAAIQQMNITEKDGSELSLRNSPAGWQLTRPMVLPADAATVEDLTAAVINMRVVEFMDHATPSMGLDKPQAVVTFSTTAAMAQPTTMATISASLPDAVKVVFGGFDDVNMQNVFARIPDGTIVKVPVSVLNALDKKPMDLRDKAVVDIDPAKVVKITIATEQMPTTQPMKIAPLPPMPVVLVHRQKTPPTTNPTTMPAMGPVLPQGPKTEWAIAGATQTDADDSKVSALLGELHPLHVEKYLDAVSRAEIGQAIERDPRDEGLENTGGADAHQY